MPGRVEGKVAFITGAARGQGRSHAIRLAQEGADIIAVDHCADIETVSYPMATPADLETTAKEVEALGRRVYTAHADVRDYASLKAAVDAGVAELGRLDIVSSNAGILSNGQSHELSEDTWGQMIDINLSGVWRTCKAAIPHLIAGGRGGSIILTSSVAGLRSYNGVSHYVSAKHGVVGLMKTLAQELAPHSIRVNTVNPTQVDTDMIQNESMYHLFCPDIENPTREDFGAASAATILLPVDWVESIDVSNAVLFLASDEARYITGVALPIDAGALTL
ncbi:MAG TPA: mycofactocin-coupled SDR family oxidoreductase [Jatrophihabitans sp.]|nr:mycofactocin-coupled SDR family oxidoreductase [Jatrophihabitans sp.]